MIFGFLESRNAPRRANEQLLKLYWNRAAVKRELRDLRRERYDLLDKLKEQEAAIATLTEEVDGWKRKYEFMASDSSPPYRSAAEK